MIQPITELINGLDHAGAVRIHLLQFCHSWDRVVVCWQGTWL